MVFLGKMTRTMVMIMEIFKDNNNWNEKSIIGFIAFAIMCVIMIADLVTGYVGKDLIINEFVYDSFVFVVLGCFGISGLEKFAKKQ
jgi:formate-dependent nitrite reductase membrane component NrfD